MKKLILIVSVVVVAVGFFFYFRRKPSEIKLNSPNVLLITIDTLRPDHLSCYGSSNRTPNIDAIASEGSLFQNAFSQVPLTFPSHTSILTGLFPVHHGVHQNGLEIFKKKDALVTQQFRKAGYKTGAIVSSFVLDRKFGLAEGFDEYDDRMERLPGISSNFEVERPGAQVLEHAETMLNSFGNGKWFVWLHFYDPHSPYAPPAPFSGYDGEIQFVDQEIGKLRAWMKEKSLDRNLILVVMADHGESLGEHGEATHGYFVYNSTLRIPLILTYPGGQPKTIGAQAAAVDLAPTLLSLAGLHDPLQRDGQSLLNLENDGKRLRPIYFESHYAQLLGWNGLQGIFQNNWKLISTTRSELYDWQKDRGEAINLYSQQEGVSRALKGLLTRYDASETNGGNQADPETLEKLRSLGYISTTAIVAQKGTDDPKDKIAIWANYERSLQLRNAGKKDEALSVLASLTQKEPKNVFFHISLATAYREAGNNAPALSELKTAIKINPSDANTYHEMALTYKDMREFNEALRAEDAAILLKPERSEFRSLRGNLLVETAQFEKAKAEFAQVLKMDPNNAVAWNNLGNALRETGRIEEAEKAYRKAIDLSPHYAYPLNGLATILISQNRTSEAIPYLEKALNLEPQFFEVYLNLGIAYHTIHQTEKAKTLYKAFLKIAPDWMEQQKQNARLLLSQLP